MQKCLNCLKEAAAGRLDHLYTTALLSYTFALAGDVEMKSKLITYLHQKSNTRGETATSGLFKHFFGSFSTNMKLKDGNIFCLVAKTNCSRN